MSAPNVGRVGGSLACALLLGALGHPGTAQTMRSFAASHAENGESLLHAQLVFRGGTVTIAPGPAAQLFSAHLRYDADRFLPIQQYDAGTHTVRLGLETTGNGGVRVTSRNQLSQVGRFTFAPDVPLELTADLGASEASLELGGLTLTSVDLRASTTRGAVAFTHPNLGSCQQATFQLTAGQLEIAGLANAACSNVRVEGGAGNVVLGFEGSWRTPITVVLDISMGGVTLRVPNGTGLRLITDRFLSTLTTRGLAKTSDGWASPGFATAPHRVTVQLTTAISGVEIRWIE